MRGIFASLTLAATIGLVGCGGTGNGNGQISFGQAYGGYNGSMATMRNGQFIGGELSFRFISGNREVETILLRSGARVGDRLRVQDGDVDVFYREFRGRDSDVWRGVSGTLYLDSENSVRFENVVVADYAGGARGRVTLNGTIVDQGIYYKLKQSAKIPAAATP